MASEDVDLLVQGMIIYWNTSINSGLITAVNRDLRTIIHFFIPSAHSFPLRYRSLKPTAVFYIHPAKKITHTRAFF